MLCRRVESGWPKRRDSIACFLWMVREGGLEEESGGAAQGTAFALVRNGDGGSSGGKG